MYAFLILYSVSRYGETRESVVRTIDECIERNILREYLQEREVEVMDIMTALFDDDAEDTGTLFLSASQHKRIHQYDKQYLTPLYNGTVLCLDLRGAPLCGRIPQSGTPQYGENRVSCAPLCGRIPQSGTPHEAATKIVSEVRRCAARPWKPWKTNAGPRISTLKAR